MIKLRTEFAVEVAHRLISAYSVDCKKSLHGHSYKINLEIKNRDGSEKLNPDGMMVDFKLLKELLRDKFEKKYDHSCVLAEDDVLVEPIKTACEKVHIWNSNPTAERMVIEFAKEIQQIIDEGLSPSIVVSRLEVYETAGNCAIWEL